MKNIFRISLSILLILTLALSIISCDTGKKDDNDKGTKEFSGTINIATLNGTTGFGMAKLMSDAKNSTSSVKYNVDVQSDAAVINAALVSGELDIAALPTNAAANLYAKTNGGIKILAVNTLGVLYVVADEANSDIKTLSDLEGKTVYCPAQNPAFIFKGLCDKAGVHVTIDSTTYAQPADLRTAVVAGKVSVAVLPEPMVTIAKSNNKSLTVALDLTAEWNKVFPENSLMQGCVVARTEFIEKHPDAIEKFLKDYKASVNYVNENTGNAAELIAETGIFEKAAVAKAAIPRCNIKFVDGKEMSDALDVFFKVLYDINPKAVGDRLPDAKIYYNANA